MFSIFTISMPPPPPSYYTVTSFTLWAWEELSSFRWVRHPYFLTKGERQVGLLRPQPCDLSRSSRVTVRRSSHETYGPNPHKMFGAFFRNFWASAVQRCPEREMLMRDPDRGHLNKRQVKYSGGSNTEHSQIWHLKIRFFDVQIAMVLTTELL